MSKLSVHQTYHATEKPKDPDQRLDLRTYELHSLGDYVETIKRYGTTYSYTTAIVSHPPVITAVKDLLGTYPSLRVLMFQFTLS
jgi:hypothetical protein